MLELADRLPRPGDTFEKDGWQFRVQMMRRRRLSLLRVIAPEPQQTLEEKTGVHEDTAEKTTANG